MIFAVILKTKTYGSILDRGPWHPIQHLKDLRAAQNPQPQHPDAPNLNPQKHTAPKPESPEALDSRSSQRPETLKTQNPNNISPTPHLYAPRALSAHKKPNTLETKLYVGSPWALNPENPIYWVPPRTCNSLH